MAFTILLAISSLVLLLWLRRKYPKFHEFNIQNAGAVLFVFSLYSINSNINMVNLIGGKYLPSLAWGAVVVVYGFMYRPNTLRLLGALKGYTGEADGWKFSTTVATLFILIALYITYPSIPAVIIAGVMSWYLIFHFTIELQKKQKLKYFSGNKLLLIGVGLFTWLAALMFS